MYTLFAFRYDNNTQLTNLLGIEEKVCGFCHYPTVNIPFLNDEMSIVVNIIARVKDRRECFKLYSTLFF